MLLNSLVIKNIRSYTHEEIIFPRGISLFEGDIGSGKSTILMAIEFALFGLGSQKAESLLAKKSESGYVILEFSVDGEKYEIKRTLKRKSIGVNQDPKNSWIKTDDVTEPLSPSELKQRVLQILKFNEPADPKAESRIFRYAIFTPQEAMKEVLGDSKKRRETIRRAFGIEDYSVAEANAKEVSNGIRIYMVGLQQKFSNIPELESEIKNSEKTIMGINSDIKKSQSLKKELDEKEFNIGAELKQLQIKNQEKGKLDVNRDNLEGKINKDELKIDNIKDEISDARKESEILTEKINQQSKIKRPTSKSIKDIEQQIKKFQEISNELIKNKSEIQSISDIINKLKNSLGSDVNSNKESLEIKLKGLKKQLKTFEKEHEQIEEKINTLNQQKIENETLKKTLESEIAEFTKLGKTCPTCKQEIDETHHHKLEDDKKQKNIKITSELEKITNLFFDLKSESKKSLVQIDLCEKEISEIEKIIPGIAEYHEKTIKLSQIEAKISDLQVQNKFSKEEFAYKTSSPTEYFAALKDELVKFENSESQIKQITEIRAKNEKLIEKYQLELKSLEVQIIQQQKELKEIKSKISSFDDVNGKIIQKEKELNSIRQQVNNVSGILAASQENLKNEQRRISENQRKITEAKKWEIKYKKIIQYHDWLNEFFIPTVSQIETQVLLSIWNNFNETYRRWYSILVEDPTKESRIDENFTPIVNQDGYEQEIGYLSGGEKTSIALAYRLTLNSLMRKETDSMKSNLLILDEPTDGFSKNQLGKIREVLDELKSEQIILVSHEKELETYVDNIFQISKQDGISKIIRTS